VAAAAGYTKGAVYSNFASKTDLFIALIERRIEVQSAEHSQRFEGLDLESMARGLEEQPDQDSESESSGSCWPSSSGFTPCATSGPGS